jgi:hypothetical protein
MNYKKDIAPCPRCNKVPAIVVGKCSVCGNPNIDLLDSYGISCCGLSGKRWISKSWAILHWNLVALNRYSRHQQLEFQWGVLPNAQEAFSKTYLYL